MWPIVGYEATLTAPPRATMPANDGVRGRILLVDDEQDLVWALRHSLRDEGYEVLTANDGVEALALARSHRPDLVVLDINMPKLDGLQVCRRIRRDPSLAAVPVIFLTVRGAVEDRVSGLDEGGDDYLVKPFKTGELKARIRALLRRYRSPPGKTKRKRSQLTVGPLRLNLYSRRLRVEGEVVQLTPTEFDLLRHLMVHAGEIFSSRQLLQQVWGYPEATANPSTVRWHIKNLRDKIEPDPDDPIYLRTVPRQGYILRA